MIYNTIYRIGYQDKHNNKCHVDILRKAYLGDIIHLEASPDPFVINYPGREKYTPVIGQGATVNFIVDGNFSLRDLYSNDILLHKVKAFRGVHCWWEGYVNTEVYTENLNACVSEISITANDGLALLSRMPYKRAGLESPILVIKEIIKKLNLSFSRILLSINQYEKRMNFHSSPLHQIYIDNSNYYDEKGDGLSSREVLEEILKPFGASLFIQDSNLVIIDNEELKKDVVEFKMYNSEFVFVSNLSINNTIDINSIDWYGEPSLDIVSGYNKKLVRYSPYPVQDMFSEVDYTNQDLWIGAPTWVYNKETREYSLNGITGFVGFEFLEGCKFVGKKDSKLDKGDYYIEVPTTVEKAFFRRLEGAKLLCSTNNNIGLVLKIPFQLKRKGDVSNITKVILKIRVKVGNMYIEGNNSSAAFLDWSTNKDSYYEFAVSDLSGVTSSWKEFECIIPSGFKPGKLSYELIGPIQVYSHKYAYSDSRPGVPSIKTAVFIVEDLSDIECMQLNPPRTELRQLRKVPARRQTIGGEPSYYYVVVNDDDIDSESNLINDMEYVGEMDSKWINTGDDVELKHGDSILGNFTDRGSFHMANDLEYTANWKRPSESLYFKLPELLLQSCVSNYCKSMCSISGSLTYGDMFNGQGIHYNHILTFLSMILYKGKRFMFSQGDYHDRDSILDCNLLEISNEQLTIERS
jgi:hypothetical protein